MISKENKYKGVAYVTTQRRFIVLSVCICLIVCFSGCRQPHHYSRSEAVAFLREEFPNIPISVSREYVETEEASGGKRHSWSAYFNDMPEVPFHVYSVWYYVGEHGGYGLNTDVNQVFLAYYAQQFKENGGELNAWTLSTGGGACLEGVYHNMDSLELLVAQGKAFETYLDSRSHIPNFLYTIDCEGLLIQNSLSFSCESAKRGELDRLLESGRLDLKKYHAFFVIDLSDFTSDELKAFGDRRWPWDKHRYPYPDQIVGRDGQPLAYETFQGLGIESTAISYGGFFDLLTHLGYQPDGQSCNFSVLGIDGAAYEFSYNFYTETAEDGRKFYYLRNGEKTNFYGAFRNVGGRISLWEDVFSQVTGLVVTC